MLEVLSAPSTCSELPEGSWDPQNGCPPFRHLGAPRATLLSQGTTERAGQWVWHLAWVLQLEVKCALEMGGVG